MLKATEQPSLEFENGSSIAVSNADTHGEPYLSVDLPPDVTVTRRLKDNRTKEEKFLAFHNANPHIYVKLVEFARQMKAKGCENGGMKELWERLRWWGRFEKDEAEEYKLPNDFTAYYARFIMEREEDLRGFFRTRELRSR